MNGTTETPIMRIKINRLPKVMETTGLGRATIYKYIQEGTFPKPVPLGGRAVGWIEEEVADWVLSRVEKRDGDDEAIT